MSVRVTGIKYTGGNGATDPPCSGDPPDFPANEGSLKSQRWLIQQTVKQSSQGCLTAGNFFKADFDVHHGLLAFEL